MKEKEVVKGYPLSALGVLKRSVLFIAFFYFIGNLRGLYLLLSIVLIPLSMLFGIKAHMLRKDTPKEYRLKFDLLFLITLTGALLISLYIINKA